MTNFSKNNTKALGNYPLNQEEDNIDLVEWLNILKDGKWLVIFVTLAVLFLGIAKAFLDKPVYKADVILQINEKTRTLAGIEPLIDLFKSTMPVLAEIELIKYRMVLGERI
jgi:tyrosine-protein kinase Etk/Wzc